MVHHPLIWSTHADFVSMETPKPSCEFWEDKQRDRKEPSTFYESYICALILFEIYSFWLKMSLKGSRGRRKGTCGSSGGKANLESQSILITHGRGKAQSSRRISQQELEEYSMLNETALAPAQTDTMPLLDERSRPYNLLLQKYYHRPYQTNIRLYTLKDSLKRYHLQTHLFQIFNNIFKDGSLIIHFRSLLLLSLIRFI